MSDNLISKASVVVRVDYDPDQLGFTYSMLPGDHGWHVDKAGNITPPPRKRVIRFELAPDSQATIFGLRFAMTESKFPAKTRTQPWFNESGLQAFVPMTESVSGSVSCVLENQVTAVLYQFGIEYQGGIVWDDPRIYSDGSI